jgi:hypothetical protein
MLKKRKSKLLSELRNEFTTRPINFIEYNECEKIKKLPMKLKAYRNSFYGSGHRRTEKIAIPFNEFELNYLIELLEFIEVEENEK